MNIVFFDGHCHLCNAVVDGLMRADKRGVLKFATLQGQTAERELGLNDGSSDPYTIVYLSRGRKKCEKSSAGIWILYDLGGLWRFSLIFFIFPRFVRDWIYDQVARNRYGIFGKRTICRQPTPEDKDRLLP